MQQGKGADSSAFGTGASFTLFGPRGSGNFMTRMTAILAILFFIVSLVLGNISIKQYRQKSNKWENLNQPDADNKEIISLKSSNDIPQ